MFQFGHSATGWFDLGQVGRCQHLVAFCLAWQKNAPPPKQGPFSGLVFGLPGVSPNCWVTRRAVHFPVRKMDPGLGPWYVLGLCVPRLLVFALCRMCWRVLPTQVRRDLRILAVWLRPWCRASVRYIAICFWCYERLLSMQYLVNGLTS